MIRIQSHKVLIVVILIALSSFAIRHAGFAQDGSRLAERFRQFDRDNDGKVTETMETESSTSQKCRGFKMFAKGPVVNSTALSTLPSHETRTSKNANG